MISSRHRGLRLYRSVCAGALITASALVANTAQATWSIILVDSRTGEIAIGSATCLTSFDLQQGASVVRVGIGAAAAQSFVDTTGRNRRLIWDELALGTDPEQILVLLEMQDPDHQTRQYGIVDVQDRAATFTGSIAGAWAGGVIGQFGTITYAIQGNVLTGEPVILAAEDAVINTPGGLPEKLMAGMEAARAMGGDGRCSCSPGDPTGCGSPPPNFQKSAHIGYMIVARPGDIEGNCNRNAGCASGDYFMNFNIAFANAGDPDPVFQLRDLFDQWRKDLRGRPDGIKSTWQIDKTTLPPDGVSQATLTFEFLDWEGNPINLPLQDVFVAHNFATSDLVTLIGPARDLGGGKYAVTITSRPMREGVDQYLITADDGIRPVQLTPAPELTVMVPPGGFRLNDPEPGIAGQSNEICIEGGTPDSPVFFLGGIDLGVTRTSCGFVGITVPRIVGKAIVGADGTACSSGIVHSSFAGRTVYLQTVQSQGCNITNLVQWTFQ